MICLRHGRASCCGTVRCTGMRTIHGGQTNGASLSILAGAAWTLDNWCALEQFSTKKRGKIPSDRIEEGGLKDGRCDLYLSNKKNSYVIEAKQAWQSIGPRANGYNYLLQQGMENAWKDAGCLSAEEADYRYAATFVVPYVPKTNVEKHGVRELVEEWLLPGKTLPLWQRSVALRLRIPWQLEDLRQRQGKGRFSWGRACARRAQAREQVRQIVIASNFALLPLFPVRRPLTEAPATSADRRLHAPGRLHCVVRLRPRTVSRTRRWAVQQPPSDSRPRPRIYPNRLTEQTLDTFQIAAAVKSQIQMERSAGDGNVGSFLNL